GRLPAGRPSRKDCQRSALRLGAKSVHKFIELVQEEPSPKKAASAQRSQNSRRPRISITRAPLFSPLKKRSCWPVTIPASGVSIVLLGLLKFGWLKRFPKSPMRSKCHRSLSWNRFRRVRFCVFSPGPSKMLMPEFPNLPMLAGFGHAGLESGHPGILKAVVSNQWLTERWAGDTLPFAILSGSPPKEFVFEGSVVEKKGENHWPV